MGVSGTWQQRAAHDYTGATRWGDGYNPIHGVRDNGRGRVVGAHQTLLPLGEPSDSVAEGLTGREIDWVCEDYVDGTMPGEHFRYQDDLPRWHETTPQFRDVTTSHAVAVPTPFVTGGWLSKQRGADAHTEAAQEPGQDRYQLAINTSPVQGQGVQSLDNQRAVQRGTDTPRTSILSRTAGMAEKAYARSFGMGGGPGTPDMQPFQQSAGLKRPWLTRVAALPPAEEHFMNTMEARVPIQRYTTPDPYQGDPEVGPGDAGVDWGY